MNNSLLQDKQVAIVGAGPVGLVTARLLQQAGVQVKVYERDISDNVRISGGTLDLHREIGQMALQQAGLLEAYYAAARPTGERAVDMDANIISREFPAEAHLYDRPEIDRNDLRRLLLGALEPGTVVWGKKFESLTETADRITLCFADGSIVSADVVIGANGGRSKLRSYVTDSVPRYTGSFLIQGEVFGPEKKCPAFKALCGEDNTGLIGAEQKMLYSQIKAGGAINYYIGFKAEEDFMQRENLDIGDRRQIAAYLKRLCHNWDDSFKELFDATNQFSTFPMREMPLDKRWHCRANITLIGDAAHIMPPFAGVGVNIGLLDGLYLVENLTVGNFSTIREAMDSYEARMFVYAGEAQANTALAEASFFS